jgi:hypothetical protein
MVFQTSPLRFASHYCILIVQNIDVGQATVGAPYRELLALSKDYALSFVRILVQQYNYPDASQHENFSEANKPFKKKGRSYIGKCT